VSLASTIAVSGLNVAAMRLQAAASNIANSRSDGPLPGAANPENFPAAHTPLRVNQVEVVGGGTSATVTAVSPATVPASDPGAPFADGNGMVASPNIDLAGELVQLLIARYTFAANAHVIRADAQMSAALLDITA
jgi:flagellar basal-body rod protein FlgC